MAIVEREVIVDVPVEKAYLQWAVFKDLPKFMEGIQEVQVIDSTHLRCWESANGKERSWIMEITQQVPNEHISWRSTNGNPVAGAVAFIPLRENSTGVNIALEYHPEGFLETIGDALGMTARRIEADLQRFKDLVEQSAPAMAAGSFEDPERIEAAAAAPGFDVPLASDTAGSSAFPEAIGMTPPAQSPTGQNVFVQSAAAPSASEHGISEQHAAERRTPERITSEQGTPEQVAMAPNPMPKSGPEQSGQEHTLAEQGSTSSQATEQRPRGPDRRHGDRRLADPPTAGSGAQKIAPNSSAAAASGASLTLNWRRLTDEFNRMLNTFWQRRPHAGTAEKMVWTPQLDATERDGELVISADLPGVDKDQVRVEINDNILTLRGERQQERYAVDRNILQSERYYGRFCRSIRLPRNADLEHAKASFNNGVLQVAIPTPGRAPGRRIEVEAADRTRQ